MRTVLRLLGTRYGIALVLVVLVVAVVGVSRLAAGSRPFSPIGPPVTVPSIPSSDPSSNLEAGNDSLVEPDASDASPSLSPNAADVSTVATHFIAAWLKHTNVTSNQWRAALKPNATSDLMGKLQDTDPGSVPADTVTGAITIADQGGSVWSASVPVNGGVVTLRLIPMSGRWQVDGIDWSAS